MTFPSLQEQEAFVRAMGDVERRVSELQGLAEKYAKLSSELRYAKLAEQFGGPREIHRRLNPPVRGLFEVRGVDSDADFWIQRSGQQHRVGRPFRRTDPEFLVMESPEEWEERGHGVVYGPRVGRKGLDPRNHLGVTVLRTDLILPEYLYYVAEYAWRAQVYQRLCHGTLQLQHIRVRDVYCALGAVIGGVRRNPDPSRRRLERAAAGGDVEAEAAWIASGIRSGELQRPQVRALACMGDPASRLVVPCDAEFAHTDMYAANDDVTIEAGPVYAVLAGFAMVEVLYSVPMEEREARVIERALEGARTWLGSPSPRNRPGFTWVFWPGSESETYCLPVTFEASCRQAFGGSIRAHTQHSPFVMNAVIGLVRLVTRAGEGELEAMAENLWGVQNSTNNALSLSAFTVSPYGMDYRQAQVGNSIRRVKPWVMAGGPDRWEVDL